MSNGKTPQASCDPTAAARMAILNRSHILDTDRDADFDGIAELAAALFDAPIAVVNFVADDRQWFKAEIGIGQRELPLDVSICRFALPGRGIFVVPDLSRDDRFSGNPLVAVSGGLRFYAGRVLESGGVAIGTVCVLDDKPRPDGISDGQRRGLDALAVQAMAALERSAAVGRDQFKLALSEALLVRDDADEMMSITAQKIGTFLGVAQVGFGIVDPTGQFVTVGHGWHDGSMPSITGRWRMDDFGPDRASMLKAGDTLVISDIHAQDHSMGRKTPVPHHALAIRSLIVVPLARGGVFAATLFVVHPDARRWSDDDVALVKDCAARLWSAVLQERADADIKTRSHQLAALIGSAPIGFAYFDRERHYLRINDALATINGLAAADHIGVSIDALLPATAAIFSPIIDRVFATGETAETIEFMIEMPQRREPECHFMASYFPVLDDEGHIQSVGAWVVEITERKRAENAQRASEARLLRAQDLGGIGSWEWDHATGQGQVSPSYRALHGMPGHNPRVSDAELRTVMHPGDYAVFSALVHKGMASGERMVFEYRVSVPGLSDFRWIRGTGQRVGSNRPAVTAGIVEDVTARRVNNALVKSQSDEITAIFDAAPVGLCVFDSDLRYVRMNERLAETSGVPVADQIGRTPHELSPDLGVHALALRDRVLAGESVFGAEIIGMTPAQPGVVRTWRENWVPLRDAHGAITGIAVSSDDITDAKTAANELARALERADIAQRAARAAFYEFDPQTGLGTPSSNLTDITGYPHQPTITLQWWQLIVHPADRAGFAAGIEAATRRGEDYAIEYRIRHAAGHWLWVADRGRTVTMGSDGQHCVIGMVINIDQQRRAQLALAESEAQFRTTAEALPGMLFVTSNEGHNSYVNAGMRSFTGRSDTELLGDRWNEVVHPDDAEGARVLWHDTVASGRQFTAEYRFRRHDGVFRWHTVRALPVTQADGTISLWVGCCIDIHDRRLAEQELEDRMNAALADKRLFVELAENTDTFIQVVDLDFTWLAVNAAAATEFERIFGKRPRVGMNIRTLMADRPEHREALCAVWARALAGEEFVEIDEFGDAGIERRFYEMRFRALRDAAGKLRGAYLFGQDVTDRLHDQAELESARAQLFETQKLETIGQLTGGVAHDFNNLLTPIMGVLEMMQHRVRDDERASRLVSGALQSAERAKNLVQRLLAFARRQHLETKAIDLATLVTGMRDLIDRSIGPTIIVEVAFKAELGAVDADANQLELALLNLAVNARDAMPGGGTLRFAARPELVRAGNPLQLVPGHYVCLSISDTGTGMDTETLKRCIEPFYTSKGIGEGTGLGLSMVHGMMRQLGGTLNVVSAPGQGTTMELWLSSAVGPAAATVAERTTPIVAKRRSTILLVDDDQLVRESTADMLDRLGYDVVQAPDGTCALALLAQSNSIDALVTDYLMPGMTGRELAERARQDCPDLPVLLITGYTRLDEIGADLARLEKPFRQADFAACVAGLVGKSLGPPRL